MASPERAVVVLQKEVERHVEDLPTLGWRVDVGHACAQHAHDCDAGSVGQTRAHVTIADDRWIQPPFAPVPCLLEPGKDRQPDNKDIG
jgi:hypothetical protein